MPNIWAFLLQTVTVTLVALLLLILKWLLMDKLSPRWQYGIWSLLALRILIPANIHRTILVPVSLWLETQKALVEEALHSAYSAVYAVVSMDHVFPVIQEEPQSVTDWLFAIYAAGVMCWVLYYSVSYVALRWKLRRGNAPSQSVMDTMNRVAQRYQLKPCRVVAVPELESAFVCGVFRPVLAVPTGSDVDEKVILHELLHLKHQDALQSIFWAAVRCLHWCNPAMHYVCNRIGNDMESLCDQRVLERLDGVARREYGQILLSMASRRYARTPGTGSISNGKRNISRRIEAIARFKKYPQGMAAVSVCIGLILLSPVLIGSAAAVDTQVYSPQNAAQLLAAARIQRCTTVAGAIDTYAKGLLDENRFYLAIALPIADQPQLQSRFAKDWDLYYGKGLEYRSTGKYSVFDLVQADDGSYHAHLAFEVSDFADSSESDWPTTDNGTPVIAGTLVIPLRIWQEDDTWVVEEYAQRIEAHMRYDQIQYYGEDMPWLGEQVVPCETGTITVTHRGVYTIDNNITTNDIFGWTSFDSQLKPDAKFSSAYINSEITYQCDMDGGILPQQKAGIRVWQLDTMEDLEKLDIPEEKLPHLGGEYESMSGSSSSGSNYTVKWVNADWDGTLFCGGGGGFSATDVDVEDIPKLPVGYFIQIIFDDEIVEELIVEGVQP